ncbi:MAG: hypothetical protein PW788_12330 [Micavibrio sp.]|nr:hypothetical protein [Micavibrio sp.]
MFNKAKILASAAAIALIAATGAAHAETTVIKQTVAETPAGNTVVGTETTTTSSSSVTTHTATEPLAAAAGSRTIHVEDFDTNGDHILSTQEIGDALFKLYDTDGNQVIDNNEYERPAVLTIAPVAKTTTVTYDFNNDGIPDKQVVTEQQFMEKTQLSRFDKNGNGLSPHEFTGKYFNQVDVDKSKVIEMKEWQGVYIASIDAKNRAEAALNK